ncbi:MAG: hypothetical protein PUP93_30485 [Rhizonema sp. NSF051]|nr:hypothetical protein [Rhizonema sp. NSF051]
MAHFQVGKHYININESVNSIFINGEFAGSFWVSNKMSGMYSATSSAISKTQSFRAKHDAENWIIQQYIKSEENA